MSTPTNEPAERALTALFVDDEPAMLRAIVRALRGSALEVLTATSAGEALARMGERAVDVLVSDVDMPGMSGLELLKTVKREFPSTQRMLLTGAPTMACALEAINEGEVHRFFTKPLDVDVFMAAMRGLAERIERVRQDGETAARAAGRNELLRWAEAIFPGTLDFARTSHGEIMLDLPEELVLLGPSPDRHPLGED